MPRQTSARSDQQLFLSKARAAGVTADEMFCHPEHGWVVSPSGVRKMAAKAPDTTGKMQLLVMVQQLAPLSPRQ